MLFDLQPAALLLELLENYGCDAVVMGARGMGQPDAAGLGSVAQSLATHCIVPLTLVRESPDAVAADESQTGD